MKRGSDPEDDNSPKKMIPGRGRGSFGSRSQSVSTPGPAAGGGGGGDVSSSGGSGLRDARAARMANALERSGLTADMFAGMYSLRGPTSTISIQPTLTNGMGLPSKKPTEEVPVVLPSGSEYVDRILQAEKKKAYRVLETGVSELDLRPESRDSKSQVTHTDLDGVSTIMPSNETNVDLNFADYFSQVKIDRATAELPIARFRNSIVKTIKMNRFTIIEGSTGCGKTTQVPQFIMEDMALSKEQFNIIVTQPRRIAAISIAKRVAEERGLELGDLVGYQVGMDRNYVGQNTRLLYVTTGLLVEKLIAEKTLDKYTHIIIDEVHERDVDTDLLLMILRKITWLRPSNVKVILMSATFETERLRDYFALHHPLDNPNNSTCIYPSILPHVIKIDQRAKKLKEFYLNALPTVGVAIPAAKEFNLNEPVLDGRLFDVTSSIIARLDSMPSAKNIAERGAVLIFLPGLHEIHALMKHLSKDANYHKLWLLPLHSTLNMDQQRKVFQKPNKGNRKIIIATNIAESSITVPDVEFVIDFCLTKQLIVDSQSNYPTLQLQWAGKANCKQRAGRAGRVTDGRVFRLVYREFFDKLPDYPEPEIRRSPLEHSVLRVKKFNSNVITGTPKELLALCLDPPDLKGIRNAVVRLKRVGALSILINGKYVEEDGEVTSIGHIMSRLAIDVQLSKLIILGYCLGCLEDCIIMAACLSTKSMFSKPIDSALKVYKSRLAWADRSFSDPIAAMNAFKMFAKYADFCNHDKEKLETYCLASFLQLKRIKEVGDMIEEIKKRLEQWKIMPVDSPNRAFDAIEHEIVLKVAMCGAFYPHYFARQPIDPESLTRSFCDRDLYSSVEISKLPQNKGVLYATALQKLFNECSDQIDIEFEETKAILTFNSDMNPLENTERIQNHVMTSSEVERTTALEKIRDTAIKTSVYVAVKMRLLRMPLEIRLIDDTTAARELTEINKRRDKNISEAKQLKANRYVVPFVPNVLVSQIALPHYTINKIDIFITNIVHCGHFWAIYDNPITKRNIMAIRKALVNIPRQPVQAPVIGMIVRVADSNGHFLRGRIQSFRQENEQMQAKVFIVDYGNTQWYNSYDLDVVEEQYLVDPPLNLPGHAIECKLAGLKPSVFRSIQGAWDDKSKDWFIGRVTNKEKVIAEVYSVIAKVARVILFVKDETEDFMIDINQQLVEEGYAETSEESPASRINNELRKSQLTASQRHNQSEDELGKLTFRPDDSSCYEVLPAHCHPSGKPLRLGGPRSPLEVDFVGMTVGTHCVQARIEPDSVNSVALEADPSATYSRLLVAANLTMSSDGERRVIARDTTLMPNIRGFSSLMCLLFSPYCELFRDPDRERPIYTGALCGLGAPRDGSLGSLRAYDPDSDMPVEFDVAFANNDLALVNISRYHMNRLLADNSTDTMEFVGAPLYAKQDKIRQSVLKLLKTSRIPLPQSGNTIGTKWSQAKPELAVPERKKNDLEGPHAFLPQICVIPEVNVEKWRSDVVSQNSSLQIIVDIEMVSTTKCLACNLKSYTLAALREHMRSESHIKRMADFELKTNANEEEMDDEDV